MEEGKTRILVDLGGDPAHRTTLAFDERELQGLRGVIITHAHYDHYGGIFDLFLQAFDINRLPPIFCTESTKNFMLQFGYKEWLQFSRGARELDPTKQQRFFRALEMKIATLSYGAVYRLGDLEVILLPASHILGSAQVYIRSPFSEGLFTSDFKPSGTFLLRGFTVAQLSDIFHVKLKPNFIVVESTYGKNASDYNVDEKEKQMVGVIRDVFEHGGNLLVPCFAIGRAQEFMTYYYRLFNQHANITPLNVYFVGATTRATRQYLEALHSQQGDGVAYHEDAKALLEWTELPFVHDFDRNLKALGTRGDLRQKVSHLKSDGFNVFISSGGMLQGPALELFMELKDDAQSALFLVGYQAEGTSGNALLDAASNAEHRRALMFDGNQISIDSPSEPTSRMLSSKVSCHPLTFRFKVLQFPLFSAHAMFHEKMAFLGELLRVASANSVQVFTTHGTTNNCVELAQDVQSAFRFNARAPRINESFDS